MTSEDYALYKIYFTALSGIEYNGDAVPVFQQQAPDTNTSENYIVYFIPDNQDVSSKFKADTEPSMQVTIHTHSLKYNSGMVASAIANEIFSRIYPNKQDNPDMSADGYQIVWTKLTGNRNTPYNIQNSRNYLDKILTFTHHIFHLDS